GWDSFSRLLYGLGVFRGCSLAVVRVYEIKYVFSQNLRNREIQDTFYLRAGKPYSSITIDQGYDLRNPLNQQPQSLLAGGNRALKPLALSDISVEAEDSFASPKINQGQADKKLDLLPGLVEVGAFSGVSRAKQIRVVGNLMGK